MTTKQLAALLHVQPPTVRRWARRGLIPGTLVRGTGWKGQPGRQWIFDADVVIAALKFDTPRRDLYKAISGYRKPISDSLRRYYNRSEGARE